MREWDHSEMLVLTLTLVGHEWCSLVIRCLYNLCVRTLVFNFKTSVL